MLNNLQTFINKLIREETVLRLFNIKIPGTRQELISLNYKLGIDVPNIGGEQIISTDTLQILYATFIHKAHYGIFGYSEVENLIFGILIIRFIYLVFTKNLYTAVCISAICAFTCGIWYNHWVEVVVAYKHIFISTKYFNKLGVATEISQEMTRLDHIQGQGPEGVNLSTFYKLPYFIVYKGILRPTLDGDLYRIDPISMLMAKMDNPPKVFINMYYRFYNEYIPLVLKFMRSVWVQTKDMAIFTLATRVGKRYCPYFIRWNWTQYYVLRFLEEGIVNMSNRSYEYIFAALVPNLESDITNSGFNLDVLYKLDVGLFILQFAAVCHLVFASIFILHAALGQYFYIFFVTENVELHVGRRNKNSIYSCGYTSWQDEREINTYSRRLPKIWYGWFGRGTDKWSIFKFLQNQTKNLFEFVYKFLKKFIRILKR